MKVTAKQHLGAEKNVADFIKEDFDKSQKDILTIINEKIKEGESLPSLMTKIITKEASNDKVDTRLLTTAIQEWENAASLEIEYNEFLQNPERISDLSLSNISPVIGTILSLFISVNDNMNLNKQKMNLIRDIIIQERLNKEAILKSDLRHLVQLINYYR